ncbi:SAM-dependent methyltransferase [Streptomyces sp. SAI-208]|uniref:SAM-dependent methyltransferase n=1 Tax=unclassified Streptomyces TaxID=2593676 RepID=UPI002472F505|nr:MULTISPECIES: SAM-dependent methyltransferase [unclassified Streptomyces]MDH6516222.1 SAM-dependent methyltransferase [Streptomyces sp. SAI-090]MDH6548419.1 SAM-dependent methyltransferase [Streptomyces sp. SAI-041]MDH6567512.1 SAM-dependent methyltransferase [Streptomyces sp. SAI-117]MDH6587560.1 SAM-dependent methyltransferase [Streptomyces sp. SAI-133]MDH6607028.1 SAM-dependent methyltransferase [Streptomyces sp. SAI-208]
MTPTLVRQHLASTRGASRADLGARARDWSEIQERMLVPLYEAVYERLEVGPATRLLGLGCGSGLALLMAASRGAAVAGVEPSSPERLALARERLQPEAWGTRARAGARLVEAAPGDTSEARTAPYTLVTAFEPIGCLAGDGEGLGELLASATPLAARGAPVVLVGWGPPERCATSSVLRVATKLADPLRGTGRWRPALRDDLEEVAQRAGLRPDGSGRVSCPFGYADLDSALKGLLSTGLFDAAITATDRAQVDKEVTEALHPHQRRDGTVWMPNVFRYLIARTP